MNFIGSWELIRNCNDKHSIWTKCLWSCKGGKEAARETELAIQKNKAEVLASKSMEFQINQRIVETDNAINFILGYYPEKNIRYSNSFLNYVAECKSSTCWLFFFTWYLLYKYIKHFEVVGNNEY